MQVHKSITLERVQEALEDRAHGFGHPGFCTACGADQDGVEPDASGYECEACGEPAVSGVEEIAMLIAL